MFFLIFAILMVGLLGWIFDRFLVDFRPPNPPKIDKKSIKKSTQQPNNQNSKNLKKHCVLQWFLLHRPCHVEAKNQPKWCQEPFQNSSQINTPTCIDFGTNLAPFWEGLGSQFEAKLAPDRSKSRSKKRSKKWSPFGSLLGTIFIDFGPNLGTKMEPKTPYLGAGISPRPPNLAPR